MYIRDCVVIHGCRWFFMVCYIYCVLCHCCCLYSMVCFVVIYFIVVVLYTVSSAGLVAVGIPQPPNAWTKESFRGRNIYKHLLLYLCCCFLRPIS